MELSTIEQSITATMSIIDREVASRPHTLLRHFGTASSPVILECDDGNQWVVKGLQNGKMIFNEQLVARLGHHLGAPIPPVGFIDIQDYFIQGNPQMSHMPPGLSHGSLFIPECSDRAWIENVNTHNEPRFAVLDILYTWCFSNDRQLIYSKQWPHEVYSVDHGHFFNLNWSIDFLRANLQPQRCAEFDACNIGKDIYQAPLDRLEAITMEDIIEIVSLPPDNWHCTLEERAAMADFLYKRIPLVIDLYRNI